MMRRIRTALLLAGAVACGDERAGSDRASDTGPAATADSIAASLTYRGGSLTIHDVVAPAPVPGGEGAPPLAVYFVVMNTGASADTLDAVEITAGRASLHDQVPVAGSGMQSMVRIEAAAIPAGETLRFLPGGRHVMIEGLTRPITAGDVLPMTMVFRHAGRIAVSARVVAYGDLEGVLSGADDHSGH